MEIFVLWLTLSIVPGIIASGKGRSFFGFFMLSIILSPIIGLVAAIMATPDVKAVETQQINNGQAKKCPHCAEMVKWEAKVCRFCNKEIPA